jgi:hypothetical protein
MPGHSILEQEDDLVMKNEEEIKKKLQPLQKRYGINILASTGLTENVDGHLKNSRLSHQHLSQNL